MDKTVNYRFGVDYKLYSVQEGKEVLEEETDATMPFRFLSGFDLVLDDFEKNVTVREIDGEFDFVVPVERAYGEYDGRGIIELDKSLFTIDGNFDDENVAVGRIIQLQNADGQQFPGLVLEVSDKVRVDLNHPLAGKTLHFVGKVVEKVEASPQEIQAMIAHLTGGGGCGGCGGGCSSCDGGCDSGCDSGCCGK